MNPSAKSGHYFIGLDGQIGGELPIKVYCDMATRNNQPINNYDYIKCLINSFPYILQRPHPFIMTLRPKRISQPAWIQNATPRHLHTMQLRGK